MKRFYIGALLLLLVVTVVSLPLLAVVHSDEAGIRWYYSSSPLYRDLYLREGAVCHDMVIVSPVSVSSSGEFYPFTMALDTDTGTVVWTATVGGHVMCGDSGIYLLDDFHGTLYFLSWYGKVKSFRHIETIRGRMFARTSYGISVLSADGTVYLMGEGLSGGTSVKTDYAPLDGGMLVSSGDMLFWKTKVDNHYAIIGFDIPRASVKWVRKINIHKSYMAPYGKYLFVSGFEKLYVIDRKTGDILRSYDVAYYEPYIVISNGKLLIPRKDWLDVFSTEGGLLVRVYKDSDMVFSAYSIAGNRIINVDSENGRAYACTLTSDLGCHNRKMWVFSKDMIRGDKVYGTGLNFVVPIKDGWIVFLTYRTVPTKYINGFEIIRLDDKGVIPTGDWESPFGGADSDGMP